MQEIWKDIKGFEGLYQISNLGRVKSVARYSEQNHFLPEKILSICHAIAGYTDVSLYKDGKRYHKKPHRLVAEAFIPNPNNLPEVDHIDTNKDNNCVDNLRWVTHSENHLNPLTVKKKKEMLTGRHLPKEQVEKMSTKVNVFKDNKLVHTFPSFNEMERSSKEILGKKLWGIYAKQMINGKRDEYNGYTFSIQK